MLYLDLNTTQSFTEEEMQGFYVCDYLTGIEDGDCPLSFPQWIEEITTNGDYVAINNLLDACKALSDYSDDLQGFYRNGDAIAVYNLARQSDYLSAKVLSIDASGITIDFTESEMFD